MKIGKLQRIFRAEDVVLDDENNTVSFSFSSEEPVERWFGEEVLSHDPGSMNLERVNSGAAPFLWNHDPDVVLGMVEPGAEVRGKKGYATARYFTLPLSQEKRQMWKEGLRNISFMYQIDEMKETRAASKERPAQYTATKYTVFEISQVSIPADFKVGGGRADDAAAIEVRVINENTTTGVTVMEKTKEQLEAEKAQRDAELKQAREEGAKANNERVAAILAMGEKYAQFGAREIATAFIGNGKTVDECRAAIMEKMGMRQKPVSESDGEIGLTDKETRKYSWMRAINALANPTNAKLREAAAFEFEASEAAAKKRGKEAQGIYIPYEVLKRDLAKGTPSAGGYLVGTQHMAGSFIELLRNKSAIARAGVRVLNGLVQDVSIPKQSGGASAYWVAEGNAPTESAPTFGQVSMSPKTVGAYVDMSRKLLIQSDPSIEALVQADIVDVLALAVDLKCLYGSGSSNEILGVSAVSGINTKDLAGSAPTYLEAIDMETKIAADNADVAAMKYICNATMRGALKGTVKFSSTDSQTVWEPGEKINGYDAIVSNQVTDGDLFFGNWGDALLGYWSGLDLSVDRAALATSGGLRVIVLQDVDFAVRHAESFCFANANQ